MPRNVAAAKGLFQLGESRARAAHTSNRGPILVSAVCRFAGRRRRRRPQIHPSSRAHPPFLPRQENATKQSKTKTALVALLALVFLAAPASAARSLKQVDPSVRQETAKSRIIAKLRRGASVDEADDATSVFGKGNFERNADLRTVNNLNLNLRKYAKPTDTGARGQVAARIHSKLMKNYDGDTEDGVNFIHQAAQKNVRLTLLRGAREDAEAGK